jgi:hypothetical protein
MTARGCGLAALVVALSSCTAETDDPPDEVVGGSAEDGGASHDGRASMSSGEGGPDGGPESSAFTDARETLDAGAVDSGQSDGASDPDAGDGGLAPIVCGDSSSRFVTGIVDHEFGPGQTLGQSEFPKLVLGPPRGAGCCQGSLHVTALGNGGWVIVEFSNNAIVDGPGPDFIVFENAFQPSSSPDDPFAELGTVAVSEDGVAWVEFECAATRAPYGSCAGWHPVYANSDDNDIDPLDVDSAGGDAFDLADVGVETARFVRITDRVDTTGLSGVFDLDAVGIVNALCP